MHQRIGTKINVFFILLLPIVCQSQIGGQHFYEFLNISNSARITSLGGTAIAVKDDDVSMAYFNPAALNESMHGGIHFSHNFYLGDLSSGYLGYGHRIESWDLNIHGGISYMSYGSFKSADDLGNQDGEFSAAEQAITLGASRTFNTNYSAGVNLKFINSRFESFNSVGLAADLAVMYFHPQSKTTVSLVVNNAGIPLTYYSEETDATLPMNVQVGFSRRLKHLPFRYSIIPHHLEEWNITYDDPAAENQTLIFGEDPQTDEGVNFFDNLFRHFVFNGEFLFGKTESFRLRLGYNHLRRKELSLENQFGLSGFSFGVGFRVSKFKLDYGYSSFHRAAGSHHLSVSTHLSKFLKEREI